MTITDFIKKRLSAHLRFVVFLICSALPTISLAGTLRPPTHPKCTVSFDGPVETGDYERLKGYLESNAGDKTICLNSPGGLFREGLRIAELFREAGGAATFVDKGSACFSACAIMFLGGTVWGDLPHASRTLQVGGLLGFHYPYLGNVEPGSGPFTHKQVKNAWEAAMWTVSLILENADLLGVSREFFRQWMRHGEDSVFLINTIEKAFLANIDLDGLHAPSQDLNSYKFACANLVAFERETLKAGAGDIPFAFELASKGDLHVTITQRLTKPQMMVQTYTKHDWDTYTRTTGCDFSGEPGSRELTVRIWLSDVASDHKAERKVETVRNSLQPMYFFPPTYRFSPDVPKPAKAGTRQ